MRRHSDETKAKMSEAHRGKKKGSPSPQTIEKIRQSNLGKKKRSRTEDEKIRQRKLMLEYWGNKSELEMLIHVEKCIAGRKKKS